MIITIHQPEHLPWLGFFNKMAKAEVFVILDSVQFAKNYFQNRNRILVNGVPRYVGIPVQDAGRINGSIASTKIAVESTPRWRTKYLNTIQMSYAKHPYFRDVFGVIEEALSIETDYLYDINYAIIKSIADRLDIHPEFVRSSELSASGAKSDLILDICKTMKTSTYIAGPSGRDYLDMESFQEAGIRVLFNDYVHPIYPQKGTSEFVSHLSALDLFMNCGFIEGRRIILEGNTELNN